MGVKSQETGETEATGQPGVVQGVADGAAHGGTKPVRGAGRVALDACAMSRLLEQLEGGTADYFENETAAAIGAMGPGPMQWSNQGQPRTGSGI